ncbi:response regulator [Nodosilinea sp. E11]|uniref:response regulator n=1 Tax=Nodosilinea sp. E11 TaxID=3037479 RepID=UPI002934C5C9|nr:response regulator [Nodosilinea sp. E11]WOD39649.1 response regulator [Nodosilinea sp. E11]
MQILVVDDSAVDRQFLSTLLEDMGHRVEASDSTEGVVEKLSTGEYSCLFLDIVMPEQDGYKFLREIRTNQVTAQQNVVFCSSKKTPVEVKYGLKRAGANDYITKPVSRERLAEVLQKL